MLRHSLILAWTCALIAGTTAASCRPTLALADPQSQPAAPAESAQDQPDAAQEQRDAAKEQRNAARDAARAQREAARSESERDAARSEKEEKESAQLEAQLEKARKQLEAAARQVAELSAQMSQPVIHEFMTNFGDETGHAIIGVQLARGGRVREVSPGGPAAEAGIQVGDVVVAVNGKAVGGENASRDVMRLMKDVKPDSKVAVRVQRDGKPHEFTVTARPGLGFYLARGAFGPGPEALPGVRGAWILRGGAFTDMELATLTPQLGQYFGTDHGVLVVRAPTEGALRLQDGDVILSIDGRQPTSGSHATRILGSYQPGEKVHLHVMRDHKPLDLEATVPEHGGDNAMWRTVPVPPVPPVPAMPNVPAVPPVPPVPRPPEAMNLPGDSI